MYSVDCIIIRCSHCTITTFLYTSRLIHYLYTTHHADRRATDHLRINCLSRIWIRLQKGIFLSLLRESADIQLIYDQHLSHYIGAFIANHLPNTSDPKLAAPVLAHSNEPVEGRPSAWSKGVDRLRRRGGLRKKEDEDGEPLIRLDERLETGGLEELNRPRAQSSPAYHQLAFDLRDKAQDHPTDHEILETYGQSLYDHDNSESSHTLIPNQSHDDEIKSTIFKLASMPKTSDMMSPTTTLNEEVSESSRLFPPAQEAGPSGTFSFLSLSQVSSPEAPAAMLESMTFAHFGSITGTGGEVYADGDWEESRNRRDEVISMPDTGYTSDAFSNVSSPRSGIRSSLDEDYRQSGNIVASHESGEGREGGLGLAVEDLGLTFIPLRRQESVMSLSESEGGSGSDWERVSVARSA